MTLSEVEDELHKCPGLEESFVAEFQHSELQNTCIRKQGGDGFEEKLVRYSEFRVRLSAGKKRADETAPTLKEAMTKAFAAVGVAMPAAFTKRKP